MEPSYGTPSLYKWNPFMARWKQAALVLAKIGTQNGTLVNGNMDKRLWSNSWWLDFDPYPYCVSQNAPYKKHANSK